MSDIEYDLDALFIPVSVTIETPCLFCGTLINPQDDNWLLYMILPSKSTNYLHLDCFETLSWLMTRFVFSKRGNLEPETIMN